MRRLLVWFVVGCGEGTAENCETLPPICGPMGTTSCCDSPSIPGGTFYRSHDVAMDGAFPNTSYPAAVSTFRLDRYEVTVGRFRQFVNAGMGTQENPPRPGAGARALNGAPDQAGWDASWNARLAVDTTALIDAVKCGFEGSGDTWTDTPGARDNQPMVCITWYEATAFCAWDGGFLPTEAEWNYAAAGGSEQRAYPWSSPPGSTTIDCSMANFSPNGGSCVASMTHVGATSPGGDGLWGHADLGGNAWEWVLDGHERDYLSPCSDCANLSDAVGVIRGGSLWSEAPGLRGAHRHFASRELSVLGRPRYTDVGVRCARPAL